MKTQNMDELLKGEIALSEAVDAIFNTLENDLLDNMEVEVDFKNVSFISVYFLERLENYIKRAQELNVRIKLLNVQPSIYKVFQVTRIKDVLTACVG